MTEDRLEPTMEAGPADWLMTAATIVRVPLTGDQARAIVAELESWPVPVRVTRDEGAAMTEDRLESAAERADRRYREDARIIGSWPGDWQTDVTEDRLEAIRAAAYSGPDAEGAVRLFGRDEMRVVLAALAAVIAERDAARRDLADNVQMKRDNAAAAEACYDERDAWKQDAERLAEALSIALEYIHLQTPGGAKAESITRHALAAHRSLR